MKIIVAVLLFILTSTAPAASAIAETAEPAHIDEPKVEASGAVLMDYWTGRVLWGKNEHTPMAMASTTKIMTAVLALESGKLDEMCVASKRAAYEPKVKMGLSPGETIKLSDLLYALMLESQNDAAVAIAEHIGGTVEDFCVKMTEKAKEIGANDTVFETPNGLDKGDHHSTAYDMAIITRYALMNPEFVKLINTKEISFKSDRRSYSFINKNRFLYEYEGANGVKTGFTNKAGHCFVGAALHGDMELITVVLLSGKSARWADTKGMMNYGFTNFKYRGIAKTGWRAGIVPVTRSRSKMMECVFGGDVMLPLRSDEADCVKIERHLPEIVIAPVEKGDVLGEADVSVNGQLLARVPLTAASGVERHDFKTSIEKVLNCAARLSTQADVKIVLPEF